VPETAAFNGNFVGRTNEIARLSEAWARAALHSGSLVLIDGEGGIGKTRLTEEVASHAKSRSGRVVWGRCYEGEDAPGFWPWIQVVTDLQADVDVAALGSAAGTLALLVPNDGEPPPEQNPVGGREERFRLSQAVNLLLRTVSDQSPLLVILEDLHWADEGSLKLLEFIAMQGALDNQKLLILATYRSADPDANVALRDSLARLTRGPNTSTRAAGAEHPPSVCPPESWQIDRLRGTGRPQTDHLEQDLCATRNTTEPRLRQ
jgi:predicted ATPase